MDEIFWLGQIVWLMFLGCGAYLSLAYIQLADEESARTVKPDRKLAAAETVSEVAGSLHPIS